MITSVHAVAEILEGKGRESLEIDAGATVLEAVQRMVERNVGSLLVRDGQRSPGSSPNATTCGTPRRAATTRLPSGSSCPRRSWSRHPRPLSTSAWRS